MKFYYKWDLCDVRVLDYIQKRYISGIFGVVTGNYYHQNCSLSESEKKKKIDSILKDGEVRAVLSDTKIGYSINPINSLQAWAFNHQCTNLLMVTTSLKRALKKRMFERK
jgi:hypothetical protein